MKRLPGLWVAAAALALGAVTLGLLSYFSIHLASNALRHEVELRVDATAAIASTLIETDTRGLVQVVQGYASRPTLRAALESPPSAERQKEIAAQLRELRLARPGIATTFIARPSGVLIEIDPATPSIVGKNFSFRDWYRGVTHTGRAYVSRAYVSFATGRPRVVAAAVPVEARVGGATIGILVAAYRLNHVQQLVDGLARQQGVQITVTDRHGVLLAEPGAQPGLVSVRHDPPVAAALAGRSGVASFTRPGGSVLAAFRPVPGLGWTVSSSVRKGAALDGIGTLRTTVAAIAAGLGLLLLLGAAALARSLRRRAAAEEELNRQATINRAVLDGVRDAISMVDVDGQPVFANARMREAVAELFGDRPTDPTQAEFAARLSDPARYLEERRRERDNPDLELLSEFELTDPRRHFVRFSAPVADEQGRRLGRIVVVRDVSAEREAEQLKTDLVATVSHELRTPLTGVLGFAELLRQPDLDAQTRDRYAETIYTEATRLTQLINNFLDLQRIEAGAMTLSLESVDLRDIIGSTVEVFRGEAGGHVLDVDLPDRGLEIAADPERLTQVLANLLSNATKYTPGGGRIGISGRAKDGVVRVSVSDPGIGIPPGQQDRLFTKFFRVDSSDTRSIGGTGLGLALAREIVEAHGGSIGVHSVQGEGSTFWFELPLDARSSGAGAKPRVLVVEDDAAAVDLITSYLGDDFDVELATTGVDALERTRQDPADVVCLDVALAGEPGGWQVLGTLKGHPRTAHVPVIVCSGANGRRRAGALGAADFLTKPFTRDALLETVGKLLPARGGDVLVVDDEATVRNLVAVTLEGAGHTIREAADGAEALEAITESRPDAIVLDLMMPRLDGFAVLEQLQANPDFRAIPVLVLTARRLSPAERELLATRAVSLLQKSNYSASELRRLIDQALGRQADLV